MIFLAFLFAFTIAVAYGLYALSATGISQHPYGKIYGGAPGATRSDSRLSGRDREVIAWSRGTH